MQIQDIAHIRSRRAAICSGHATDYSGHAALYSGHGIHDPDKASEHYTCQARELPNGPLGHGRLGCDAKSSSADSG